MATRRKTHRGIHESQSVPCVVQVPSYEELAEEWSRERRQDAGDPGLSVAELMPILGVGRTRTKKLVRDGIEEGRYIEGVGYRKDRHGILKPVPVYRVAKESTK